jgi:CBS domain-containing protein
MAWFDLLEEAARLVPNDARGAFDAAYRALETCYVRAAMDRGFVKSGRSETADAIHWLKDKGVITPTEADSAHHVRQARNVMNHRLGFEPSRAEAERTIKRVRDLCSRFNTRVSDVMVTSVITASPDSPIGAYFEPMINGISYIPVVNDQRLVGTLFDGSVLALLREGEGIADPQTLVGAVMSDKVLPSIPPSASFSEATAAFAKHQTGALLIVNRRLPTGIVTPYDLLVRIAES